MFTASLLATVKEFDPHYGNEVEQAWRIVDPALKAGTPVYEYEPGTWGPKEAGQDVTPPSGWQNPAVTS